MATMIEKYGLGVDARLVEFVETKAARGVIDADAFWRGLAQLYAQFTDENRRLLAKRDHLQAHIDAFHKANKNASGEDRQSFLREIGYLVDDPPPFVIAPGAVDDEIARLAGPQLVVPARNARFALNAANARWGSLYDSLYGTDALASAPSSTGYDPMRGAAVIARARAFLDAVAPLASGTHADVEGYAVVDGQLSPALAAPENFVGYRGAAEAPAAILLRHHGLHIEIVIDRHHRIGRDDRAGVADVVVEAALTTIIDLEDSIAAVDAEDKVEAYAIWLGLLRGDLEAQFEKNGQIATRRLEQDKTFTAPKGGDFSLSGRSVLFVRNVGHHMMTPVVRLGDGSDAPEGILDAAVTSLIGMHDVRGLGRYGNSRTKSIYIVKPKMHGPEEVAFCSRLFDAVEDMLGLPRYTIKIGLMDEERRTSANLAACLHAVKDRIVFTNTGFLDRTGDEIHTSMQEGAMLRKGDMKSSTWLAAYENRSVEIALASGFSGRAQLGKGMWAAPDRMAHMLEQKIAHPRAGATTAWVPSPTAATLHALHYHEVDVFALHRSLLERPKTPLSRLLDLPTDRSADWRSEDIGAELDNNIQGILGYVVRWIDQGVGCSKVPDIDDVGLMEDRATLRISSQHVGNWLLHGIVSKAQVEDCLLRMARRVDAQNAADPLYRAMSADPDSNLALQAARTLIFDAAHAPNGYTEAVLHAYRLRAKAFAAVG